MGEIFLLAVLTGPCIGLLVWEKVKGRRVGGGGQ